MSSVSDTSVTPDILPSIAESTNGVKDAVRIKSEPPRVTTSFTEEYIEACARSNERASLQDRLTLLFQSEKFAPLPNESTHQAADGRLLPTSAALWSRLTKQPLSAIQRMVYNSSIDRLHARCSGAFIAEAGGFAALTCWEPRFAPPVPPDFDLTNCSFDTTLMAHSDELIPPHLVKERPIFASFNEGIEKAKLNYMYPILWKHAVTVHRDYLYNASCPHTRTVIASNSTQKEPKDPKLLYWKLCMTSRNPSVQPPVPGAVRAVIEPFIKRWVDTDGMPVVWLEAGSPRARDVYSWLGFRVVDEIETGLDQEDNAIKTWFMIYTKEQ